MNSKKLALITFLLVVCTAGGYFGFYWYKEREYPYAILEHIIKERLVFPSSYKVREKEINSTRYKISVRVKFASQNEMGVMIDDIAEIEYVSRYIYDAEAVPGYKSFQETKDKYLSLPLSFSLAQPFCVSSLYVFGKQYSQEELEVMNSMLVGYHAFVKYPFEAYSITADGLKFNIYQIKREKVEEYDRISSAFEKGKDDFVSYLDARISTSQYLYTLGPSPDYPAMKVFLTSQDKNATLTQGELAAMVCPPLEHAFWQKTGLEKNLLVFEASPTIRGSLGEGNCADFFIDQILNSDLSSLHLPEKMTRSVKKASDTEFHIEMIDNSGTYIPDEMSVPETNAFIQTSCCSLEMRKRLAQDGLNRFSVVVSLGGNSLGTCESLHFRTYIPPNFGPSPDQIAKYFEKAVESRSLPPNTTRTIVLLNSIVSISLVDSSGTVDPHRLTAEEKKKYIRQFSCPDIDSPTWKESDLHPSAVGVYLNKTFLGDCSYFSP